MREIVGGNLTAGFPLDPLHDPASRPYLAAAQLGHDGRNNADPIGEFGARDVLAI